MRILIVIFLFFANTTWAHTIAAVKANRVLLVLDGASVNVGDIFSIRETNGTEVAQIQVQQIKNQRALAVFLKGQMKDAPKSYQVQFLSAGTTSNTTSTVSSKGLKIPQARGYYGGFSYNQLSVSLTNSTTLRMSGLSFNLGAFYDRALTSRVQVLARAGYEGLAAKGSLSSNACSGEDCRADIGYLSGDALVKYSFYMKNITWWGGGGLGFLFPLIKSSNVLDTSKMTLTERVLISGGLNWYHSPNVFIPIQLDYAIQPSNNVVSIQQLVLRAGYGQTF